MGFLCTHGYVFEQFELEWITFASVLNIISTIVFILGWVVTLSIALGFHHQNRLSLLTDKTVAVHSRFKSDLGRKTKAKITLNQGKNNLETR